VLKQKPCCACCKRFIFELFWRFFNYVLGLQTNEYGRKQLLISRP
jgi:hypothetical protein